MTPYRLSTDGPGQADVIDRGTGEMLGYVWKDNYGEWMPYVWEGGHGRYIGIRYTTRADSAKAVWAAARG